VTVERFEPSSASPERLDRHRLARAGVFAWSAIGLLLVVWVTLLALDRVRLAVVPLAIALFPAALLVPLSDWLKRRGLRPALAAAIVVVFFTAALLSLLTFLGWLIANEVPAVIDALREAYTDIQVFVADRFDVTIPGIDELLDRAQEWLTTEQMQARGWTVAATTFELVSGFLLMLVALFFYLKDGDRLADFALSITPERWKNDIAEIGRRVWGTLGGYFRGQLLVAFVDAFFIGLGLFVLQVPLALPLAVLVFIGGLFPIVGAFTAGAVAVLVALADAGLPTALAVLVLNIVVQQAEGNLLEPLIVGRATRLHPLAVLVALTAGAVTLGILGAFLAVPVAASIVRVVAYVREKHGADVGESASQDDQNPPGETSHGDEREAGEGGE
jgi:putative heme transporter